MQDETMEAFEFGWKAGLLGLDPRLCPYDHGTREWCEWRSFHRKASELAWWPDRDIPAYRLAKSPGAQHEV